MRKREATAHMRCNLAWRRLLAFLVLMLLWPGAALAAAEPELVAVEAGWDGYAAYGAWIPVHLRVRGGEQDLQVQAEVWPLNRYQTPARTVDFPAGSFGVETALPAGVEKDLTVWLPLEGTPHIQVRITSGGQLLASRQMEIQFPRDPGWPLVGVLARDGTLVQAARAVTIPIQGLPVPVAVAGLTPGRIPAEGDLLGAFRAIMLQGGVAAELTAAQRQALVDWVRAGGLLILSGGPTLAQDLAVLPPATLPIAVEGSATGLDLTELAGLAGGGGLPEVAGTAPVARVNVSGGAVLAGTPEQPLVWRGSLGQGNVTVLAVDLGLEPLVSWAGRTPLLQGLLAPVLPGPEAEGRHGPPKWAYEQEVYRRLAQLTNNLPPQAFPDWKLVGLIMAGFALVAGPLVHLLLRRWRRQEWVWLVVPALAVLTGAGLYLLGVVVQQRDLLVNVVSHLQLDGRGGGIQRVAVGFFAPTRESLTAHLPGQEAVRVPVAHGGSWRDLELFPDALPQDPPFRLLRGRSTTVEFRTGQWQMRTAAFDRELGAQGGQIEAQLQLEGNAVVGSITNGTPYHLEDAAVVLGQSVAMVGNLAPGASGEVRLELDPDQGPFDHGPPLSWRFYSKKREQGSQAQPGPQRDPWHQYEPPPRDAEIQRRRNFLDVVANRPSPEPDESGLPLTFMAFTRDPVANLPLEPAGPTHYLSLIQQPLSLHLPPGPFRLPPGMAYRTVTEITSRGWGGGSSPTLSWMEFDGGAVVFEFAPPLPPGARVERLEVTTRLVTDPRSVVSKYPGGPPVPSGPQTTAAEAGIFQIFNWEKADWDSLPAGQEVAEIPAGSYVGADNLVKVRVVAPEGKQVRFVVPSVGYGGRVDG